MNWYIAKIVFRIITGDGDHKPQFDEQLRLINANNEEQAFEKSSAAWPRRRRRFFHESEKTRQ